MKDLFFCISCASLVYGYTLHLPTLTILSFSLFVISFPKVNFGHTPPPTPNHPPSSDLLDDVEESELKEEEPQAESVTDWEEVEYFEGGYKVGERLRNF